MKYSELDWQRSHDIANFVFYESMPYVGKVVYRGNDKYFARVCQNNGNDYHMIELTVQPGDLLKYHCTSPFEAALKKACELFDKGVDHHHRP